MKLESNETTLYQLMTSLDEKNIDGWVKSCEKILSEYSRSQLSDVLRDISIELRPNSGVSDNYKNAIERLKEMVLAKSLKLEKEASLSTIKALRKKMNAVPIEVGSSIKNRLDNLEKDVHRDDFKTSSIQERLINSEKTGKNLEEIEHQFEFEIKRRNFEQDEADRIQDRKSRKFEVFSDKDSFTNFLGGALLFILALSLVAAMWFEPKPGSLEVIKNGFFIILGFFFGQGVNSSKKVEGNK